MAIVTIQKLPSAIQRERTFLISVNAKRPSLLYNPPGLSGSLIAHAVQFHRDSSTQNLPRLSYRSSYSSSTRVRVESIIVFQHSPTGKLRQERRLVNFCNGEKIPYHRYSRARLTVHRCPTCSLYASVCLLSFFYSWSRLMRFRDARGDEGVRVKARIVVSAVG